ncbi:MAG: bestrophin family ion channel [Candidatus Pseudobacter hemicellulosilyticus]|uniref:Bestrophin family ion channel n=1 Tax=Candidatus Pseudobacter hemicellulosilyticus TaxID=3121375 RepID=A0AAJ5WXB4_9BACT|nr:MAG: bestrophin family ion channel [Pseudobacter sp.]
MHAGRRYSFQEIIRWTRRDIYVMIILSAIPTLLVALLGWHWLALPWVPIAMIGTATAFIVGFRNTQTYNRLWEARQIYGGIVNASRSWGMLVKDLVGTNQNRAAVPAASAWAADSEGMGNATAFDSAWSTHQQLIHRHIAWLTAMRFQLREPRTWETSRSKISNQEYGRRFQVAEWQGSLEAELQPLLSPADLAYILSKKNRATHLISLQSAQLRDLKAAGLIEPLNYVELEKLLVDLYDLQGRCERIKNFPYPRQFATISQLFTRLFISLVPFGVLNEFQKTGGWMILATIPFASVVGWIFLTMERIGENTENPFEGGANDVPITAMSRTIEIDLREMLGEKELPPGVGAQNNILL